MSDLRNALEVNGKKQTKELKRLRSKENERSYILEIFDILENRAQDNSDIHITRDPKQYDENRIGSAYWDISKNVCYIKEMYNARKT